MKIGIITFHWVTNYGAILQAWCLQVYLSELGHDVEIINYKPSQFDFSWKRIVRHPRQWKNIKRILISRNKESLLVPFRKKYLYTTSRYFTVNEFGRALEKYDVLISGSDQVLNPYFTLHGENGKPSSAYWMNYGRKNAIRLGYAVSFGCETYPEDAASVSKMWIKDFDAIGVRERTGLKILDNMNYLGPKFVVPDPTLLIGDKIFRNLGITVSAIRESYTCVYMLRHEIKINGNILYIDEKHKPLKLEEWLSAIVKAKEIVTNSYHGMIMALLAHVPFAVLLETGTCNGMNDRFYTLLERVGCDDRLAFSLNEALSILKKPIDFKEIDEKIAIYRKIGTEFLRIYQKCEKNG